MPPKPNLVHDIAVLFLLPTHHNEDDVIFMCGFHNGFIITSSQGLFAKRVTQAKDSHPNQTPLPGSVTFFNIME